MKINVNGSHFHIDNKYFLKPRMLENIRLLQLGERFCGKNTGFPEHRQLCFEISYVYDGEAINSIDGHSARMTRNTFNLTFPPQSHCITAPNDTTLRYFYIGFELLPAHPLYEAFESLSRENRAVYVPDTFRTHTTFFDALAHTDKTDPLSEFVLTNCINTIFADFLRAFRGLPKATDLKYASGDIVLYTMLSYLDENFLAFENLDPLAERLGYSVSYLSHLFAAAMQKSATRYALEKKMNYAAQLLSEHKTSVTDIAALLSYEDIHSFSKAFKKFFGYAPTRFGSASIEWHEA